LEESGIVSIDSDFLTLETKVSNHHNQDVSITLVKLINFFELGQANFPAAAQRDSELEFYQI